MEHNPDLAYSNSNVIGAKGQLHLAELVNAKRCGWSKAMFFPLQELFVGWPGIVPSSVQGVSPAAHFLKY